MQYVLKLLLTTALVALVTELAKRESWWGAFFASIPITSVLAMVWLYQDTQDEQSVISLSMGIFWLVLPSLAFFIILPLCLKQGLGFYLSLGLALGGTALLYGATLLGLSYIN